MEKNTNNDSVLITKLKHENIEDAQALLREYEVFIGIDLCFQNFKEEVASLPGNYAPPEGSFLVAYVGKKPAGCVALRRNLEGICEMKRLFVREEFQGLGLGKRLVEEIIEEGRNLGYSYLRLDTLPSMNKAQQIYEDYGFYDIEPYIYHPQEGTRYMELKLREDARNGR